MNYWILNDEGEQIEADLLTWGQWLEDTAAEYRSRNGEGASKRHAGCDTVGKVRISTVFLGIDHSFGEGQPILWETMIFGSSETELADYQERYSSREEALEGHARAVKLVKDKQLCPQCGDAGEPLHECPYSEITPCDECHCCQSCAKSCAADV